MTDFASLPMRIAVGQFQNSTLDIAQFIKQMGAKDIQLNMYAGDCSTMLQEGRVDDSNYTCRAFALSR
jgi:hypothetical protein